MFAVDEQGMLLWVADKLLRECIVAREDMFNMKCRLSSYSYKKTASFFWKQHLSITLASRLLASVILLYSQDNRLGQVVTV